LEKRLLISKNYSKKERCIALKIYYKSDYNEQLEVSWLYSF
jgi:hypothetical protein